MEFLNCPHCSTQGVLAMPDGRCPNCKEVLVKADKGVPESTETTGQGVGYPGDEQSNAIAPDDACEAVTQPGTANNLGTQKPATVPDEGMNCPNCHTEGVLVMSDGRCPHCKQLLVAHRTEPGAIEQPVAITKAILTSEGVQPNRWLFFSITALFTVVQAHAAWWGGAKLGAWGSLSTVTFNWFFNISMAILAYCIVITGIKHSQKLAGKHVGTYQAYSLLNGIAFSIIVACYVPMIITIIPIAIRLHDIRPIDPLNLTLFFLRRSAYLLVIGVAILYMPALLRKRTHGYRVYLCVLSILSLYFLAITVRVYVTTQYLSGLAAFLAETPEAILYANGFQFLPIQDYVPAMMNDTIKVFILPATAIYSIVWKESS